MYVSFYSPWDKDLNDTMNDDMLSIIVLYLKDCFWRLDIVDDYM